MITNMIYTNRSRGCGSEENWGGAIKAAEVGDMAPLKVYDMTLHH